MAGRSNGVWWMSIMCLFALVVLISVMASSSLQVSAARAGSQFSEHMATQLRELEQVDKPAAVSEDAAKVDTSKPADDDGTSCKLVPASFPGQGLPSPLYKCVCADCPYCLCSEGAELGFYFPPGPPQGA